MPAPAPAPAPAKRKSDLRLKTNIQIVASSKYNVLGLRGVRWTWNDKANQLGLYGEAQGVIAQEVELLYPDAVVTTPSGYKAVRYDWLDAQVEQIELSNARGP